MGFSTGFALGPYEIVSLLGTGGMGEVYRARDTRLDRSVALKVLNSSLASTPDLKQRFEREARVISQLSHPHICALHDIGSDNGTDYLVMEYLEGETLAQRLKRGALQLDQLLKIAVETAEALEHAHRAGIIHRDLKPGNVMLTKSGAKLLDFGLAKPMQAMATASGNSSAPSFTAALTVTGPSPAASPLTSQGTLLGTIQYMSPEQVQGVEADERSDIFAFGAMLYEMATGQRPFQGKSQIKVASAILEDEPDLALLQRSNAASIEQVIRICLAKDPESRYACAHDLKLHLLQHLNPRQINAQERHPDHTSQILLVSVALLAVALAWMGYYLWSADRSPRLPLHSELVLAGGAPLLGIGQSAAALSPDGRYVAYFGHNNGGQQLWLRDLRDDSDEALTAVSTATNIIWSPDSRSIAFYSRGKLNRIAVDTRLVTTICDLDDPPRYGAWGSQGTIALGSTTQGVRAVSANGGKVRLVTSPPEGVGDQVASFFPDGKHFLFSRTDTSPNGTTLYVGATDGGREQPLDIHRAYGAPRYSDGFLLYQTDRGLVAQAFDADALRVTGDPRLLVDSKGETLLYTVSSSHLLAYRVGLAAAREISLYTRTGASEALVLAPGALNNPRLSPDGSRIAYDVSDVAGPSQLRDIWIYDIRRHANVRFTSGDTLHNDPLWSPDGKRLVVTTNLGRQRALVMYSVDGSVQPEVLLKASVNVWARSWSPDGKLLFLEYARTLTGLPEVLKFMTLEKREPQAITPPGSSFSFRLPMISPDGKWLAYTSNETGQEEVFIQPFPGPGEHVRISLAGGAMPRWRGDGREIYFLTPDRKVAAVPLQYPGRDVQVGKAQPLFAVPTVIYPGGNPLDVSSDGKLFVVNSLKGSSDSAYVVHLISNWDAELKK